MRIEYFEMLDRVVALNLSGRTIRAACTVPKQSTVFEGHFPGFPLMPGVLLIECMAQTTGWLASALGGFVGMPFLAGIKEAKFRDAVFPGDELEFEGRVIHEGSGYVVGECKGLRENSPICDARLIYRVLPYPNQQFRQMHLKRAERLQLPVMEPH